MKSTALYRGAVTVAIKIFALSGGKAILAHFCLTFYYET